MKTLTPFALASSTTAACSAGPSSSGTLSPWWVAVLGRGRSVRYSNSSGRPANAVLQ